MRLLSTLTFGLKCWLLYISFYMSLYLFDVMIDRIGGIKWNYHNDSSKLTCKYCSLKKTTKTQMFT